MTVNHNCPVLAMLNASEKMVENGQYINGSKERALGGIALTKQSLEAVAAEVDCPGQVQNEHTSQLECPLREMAFTARSTAFGIWNAGHFTVALEEQKITHDTNTGQYL